jgi:hypothetical protein
MLEKIISGGQSGADIAGLIAAKQCGFDTGGTAPKGYKTEDGVNIDLKKIYGLIDIGTYKSRTIKNIHDSDGTIVFCVHQGKGGSSKTIGYCIHKRWCDAWANCNDGFKPVLMINKNDMEEANMGKTSHNIINWLQKNNIKVLNVAGHRKSTAFQQPFYQVPPYDYQQRVTDIMVFVLRNIL